MPKDESCADQNLLRAAAGGDKQAFGILYEKYNKPIYQYYFTGWVNEQKQKI
jgi:hypothetical protein